MDRETDEQGPDIALDRLGTLEQREDGYRLEFERILRAPIERVWQAFTDVDELRQWNFARDIELQPGVRFVLVFEDDRCGGRIVAWEPPHRFAFEWDDGDPPSIVTFSLEAIEGGTRLRLVHDRIRKRQVGLSHAGGWHVHLVGLDRMTRGVALGTFESVYEAVKPLYDSLSVE